ncbi:MAG: HlyD family efflux transporter periplasmic adaptor subunit [Clostridiales bacterium]|nr:HlyD family efflux transporter periplasmic adaptor subunit [Clostridiales bacterium]
MDNQFNPPNGVSPQGAQPMGGMQPGQGYDAYGQPVQNPYGAQPGAGMPPYDPYNLQQAGYAPYPQPYAQEQQSPYQPGVQQPYQQPYGGVQQPYAEEGYQYHFDHSQSVMQEQPPTGFTAQMVKPPKPRLHLTAFHVAVIVAALGFLGWYLYTAFVPEAARYGQITSGSLSANHSGDCLIVRNEVPYDAEGVTSVVYDAEEGSRVVRGDNICKVYSSGFSTREMNTLQAYRSSIRDYQKKLIESETTHDEKLNRVMADVLNAVKAVREMIGGARGSLENQEQVLADAVEARQAYIKSKYASDQRFSRLNDDELSQTQRIHSWTKQYKASTEALVSFYSDGYEYGLTGANYTTFEPRQVRAMMNGVAPEKATTQKGKTTIYRMVQDGEWYVLFLSDDTRWNPVKGQVYQLQLERFENTAVYAEVVNFTRSGGELLVRLRVPGDVQPVLYMRSCGAVLGENVSTLCVPERAIYTQDGMTGVVVVNGSTESFIPVNVIHYDSGNAYFQAIQQGLLFEGMTVLLF